MTTFPFLTFLYLVIFFYASSHDQQNFFLYLLCKIYTKNEKPRRTKKTFDNPDPIKLKNWLKIFELAIYIPNSSFMNTTRVSNAQKCMK